MARAKRVEAERPAVRERFGVDARGLESVFATALARPIDFADVFFEYTTRDAVSIEEGLVKSGARAVEQGVGVRALRGVRMELGEPDASGRRKPVPVPGSEFEFECDAVVFAIGTNANPILGQTCKLALDKRGYIATDDSLATSIVGVWAGGDIVTGAATVIQAMGAGRRAAREMKAWLGLRDSDAVYGESGGGTLFGIAKEEHGAARVRLA